MKAYLLLLLILISAATIDAKPIGKIYWIDFDSKLNTPFSINQPSAFLSQRAIERRIRQNIAIDSTDLPVNPVYIDSLQKIGFTVIFTSKWMNGALITPIDSLPIATQSLPSFVKNIELRIDKTLKSSSTKFSTDSSTISYYGNSQLQVAMMNGEWLHHFSMGEGIHIAVIDAGFANVDKIQAFDHLRERDGILGTFDFVDPGNNVYAEHAHGTMVLSLMASLNEGMMVGTAPKASYWLLRSEDSNSEYPVEEDYWIVAAEFADSVGCDVINTSLGYSTFDNPQYNHNYEQFNGKTLRISQAANLAVDKGLVVVCSAGNSGNDDWGHIVAPSEAEKVLSVAAVDETELVTGFSSRGFEGNSPMKPDVAAMGKGVSILNKNGEIVTGSGTSFSSPIVAGMAACLSALHPELPGSEIIEMIRRASNRYPNHSIEYGYGIPDFSKLVDTSAIETTSSQLAENQIILYPNPFTSNIYLTPPIGYNHIDILSVEGRKVFSMSLPNSTEEISSPLLSNLGKGVYFAVLKGNGKPLRLKLLKY
jgi:subtilisin family serine protease